MDLGAELQKIYDSEIDIRISWLWDGGIDVWLGNDLGGYVAQENVGSASDILAWLQEAIAHFYPDSTYAQSLPQEIKERAAHRLFLPPRVGFEVRCPHCGAPHAAPPIFDELIGFICSRCGNSVKVDPPKVQ